MVLSILGLALTAVFGVSIVGGLAHAFVSGEWKNWGILEWLANIVSLCSILLPFFNVFKVGAAAVMAIGGGAIKLLSKVPLLGTIVTYLHSFWIVISSIFVYLGRAFYFKGSWLYEFGTSMANFARFVGKHPWLVMGLMFASTMFDSIIRHIFQMWGDLSLKAADFAYERLSILMSDGGYGDPVSETVQIMDDASNSLPQCFTAIWGAVGASECIGLVIMTFQYIVLVYALSKSFSVAGVK